MSTTGVVDTKQQPGPTKRRQYSEALKRQMVAETQAPGASVSIVARRHDVTSNQLFRLRWTPIVRQPEPLFKVEPRRFRCRLRSQSLRWLVQRFYL